MSSERMGHAYFRGASGATYKFAVYEPGGDIPSVGGVFLVSGISRDRAQPNNRRIWLIGRSPDMSRTANQMARHARLEDVERRLICIHVEDDSWQTRNRIAKDLAAAYRPHIRIGV